jgi:hypothetical protein
MIHRLNSLCGMVECCSPVVIQQLCGQPNDPKVPEQRMLETIRAFEAWDVEGGSDSVLIGISDSGVLQDHEDLKDAIHVNVAEIPDNGVDDDGNGYVDDYRGYNFCTERDGTPPGNTFNPVEGHGTGVSGICAAVVNNGIGVAGVANMCRIVPLKTMPNNINGIVFGYESMIFCATNQIPVMNCSWGSHSKSCIDESVVAYTIARGTAIVAAAGNHGTATAFYPGSYPGVLNVGVSDPDDAVIAMTGHGPTVDVMAPGQWTVTTSNDGTYGGFCCTSGSSPIVAAVVGLVRSRYPNLSPLQACALVRESAKPSPWTRIEGTVRKDLLPYGRLDALGAVTQPPDSLPSIEWDSVITRTDSPDGRWGVGDTISVTMYGTNVLADWDMEGISALRVEASATPAIELLGASERDVSLALKTGDHLVIEGLQCLVTRATDSTAYLLGTLHGKTNAGAVHERPIQIGIVPQPAFRTVANNVLKVSLGDRGRIGNTDISLGQGAGLTYKQFCGQLFEGGLIVGAGERVVDAVRAERGSNNHFLSVKPYANPDPMTVVFTDANAPDSLRLGIEVMVHTTIADGTAGMLVMDVTLTNTSDSTLQEVGCGWFMDWDLGTNPVFNYADGVTSKHASAVELGGTGAGEPKVLQYATTYHSDGTVLYAAIDNATTYGGFPLTRKSNLLRGAETGKQFDDRDVAAFTGVRFTWPLQPGAQRVFRQVILIDEDANRLVDLVDLEETVAHPQDSLLNLYGQGTLGEPYPNPSAETVCLPLPAGIQYPATLGICDVQGRTVWSEDFHAQAPSIITISVAGFSAGSYEVRLSDPAGVRGASMLILR